MCLWLFCHLGDYTVLMYIKYSKPINIFHHEIGNDFLLICSFWETQSVKLFSLLSLHSFEDDMRCKVHSVLIK